MSGELAATLRSALPDLFDQEFSYSAGHVATIVNTCLFAPSLLTSWFVNGVLDFSTAVASPAGLQVRLLAYVFVVPTFLLVRVAVHLFHPTHRAQVLSGSCPTTQLLSLDWFSMGILATGLPLALQNFGPWFGMNAVFVAGLFGVPRFLAPERAGPVKLLAIVAGPVVFLYANYGGAVPAVPDPVSVLGPVATFTLDSGTTEWLFRAVNSVVFALTGRLVVAP